MTPNRKHINMSGPFSYVAWLPEAYPSHAPCWGARLIVNGLTSVSWVGDRITYKGPRKWCPVPINAYGNTNRPDTGHWDYDQTGFQEWIDRAGPVIDATYEYLNGNFADLSTQHRDDRCFQQAVPAANGISVWYCCIHGYCHMVAIEDEFAGVTA